MDGQSFLDQSGAEYFYFVEKCMLLTHFRIRSQM